MSTLTITNAEKPVVPCLLHEIGYTGANPGEDGSVTYYDCSGVLKTDPLTWGESGGNYYTINICAREVVSLNDYANDNGALGSCL